MTKRGAAHGVLRGRGVTSEVPPEERRCFDSPAVLHGRGSVTAGMDSEGAERKLSQESSIDVGFKKPAAGNGQGAAAYDLIFGTSSSKYSRWHN